MNKVILTGRLTKDPESNEAGTVCKFSIAVNRAYHKDGDPAADFINCVVFGKQAEFVKKYFAKGNKADLVGRIQTGSYTNKDGNKVYTTDVVVEQIEFGEKKGSSAGDTVPASDKKSGEFMSIPDGVDEELPFN